MTTNDDTAGMSASDDTAAMSANGDTHDPLCGPPWSYGRGGHCEGCDLIAKARADERQKLLPAWWSQEYHAGYRQGYEDANKGKKAQA